MGRAGNHMPRTKCHFTLSISPLISTKSPPQTNCIRQCLRAACLNGSKGGGTLERFQRHKENLDGLAVVGAFSSINLNRLSGDLVQRSMEEITWKLKRNGQGNGIVRSRSIVLSRLSLRETVLWFRRSFRIWRSFMNFKSTTKWLDCSSIWLI